MGGPGIEVERCADGVRAYLPEHIVELRCDDGEIELKRGETEPICGWVSPRFGEKVPSYTVVCRTEIDGSTELRAQFAISRR